jgi:predicted deacylase
MAGLTDLEPGHGAWRELPIDPGRTVDVFAARGRTAGPAVAVVAGVHGDEYEGIAAVRDLAERLDPAAVRGTLLLVPAANPTALAAGTRTNPEDGRNLARSFPGDAAGTPTERLAARLFGLCAGATHLIDLHSGGVEYRFMPVAGFYGPPAATNPSFVAAARFGLDALWRLPPTPGVLSFELHRRGACAVGCEYLGGGQLSPEGRARYLDGVCACLAAWGVLPDGPPCPAPPAFEGDWLTAEADGLFEAGVSLGEAVEAGRELAVVCSVRGAVRQRFVAPAAGTVLALRAKAFVRAGAWGVLVGTPAGGARD